MKYVKFSKFIVSTQYGYTAEETSLVEGDAKYLRITDIVPYFVNKEQVPFCKIDDNKKKKYLINENDLLIARTGATTGYNLVVDESYKNFVFASYLIRFNYNKNDLYPLYLKYVLKSQQWYGFVNNFISGSAQPGMNAKAFGKFQIPFFNYDIQKRISNILSTYDKLIDNNNKRIKLLEQMAENLYKEWFVRFRFPGYENTEFENGIPKGWKIERLSDIADIIMGQSPKSENYNTNREGLPFHQGVGSYGDFYLIDDIYSTKGNRIAEANSIIFSVRAPVGRINITLNKIILGRGVASINSVKGYNAYLLWMLKNQFQQEDIIGNGSIFTSVTKKELFDFKILMPHDDLIRKFDSIAFGIESEMRKLSLINDNLAKQRDMLLPRLMSGKLEV